MAVGFRRLSIPQLNTAGIQHDSHTSTNGLRRQVTAEAASDDTIGTVSSADLSPIDAERAVLCLGDKSNSLAQVKISICLAIAALDLNQRNIGILRTEGTLVAQNGGIYMQAGSTLRFGGHGWKNSESTKRNLNGHKGDE